MLPGGRARWLRTGGHDGGMVCNVGGGCGSVGGVGV